MPPGASQSAAHGLRRSREPWGDHAPIRAELFNDEVLERHAVSLADSQVVGPQRDPGGLAAPARSSRTTARSSGATSRSWPTLEAGRGITPAAEWLVDNFHTVEENIRQVRQDLPRGYFRQLPKLGPGFLEGHPRIFGIMWAYVAHTDSNFDPDQLGRYIRAHETRKALTLGELWAVPINLRILLIENVRRVSEQVVAAAEERAAADEVADRLLGIDGSAPERPGPGPPRHAPASIPRRAFAVQLIRRLTEQPADEALAWVRAELLAPGTSTRRRRSRRSTRPRRAPP